MKFSFSAVLAFATTVFAVKFTNSNFDIEEGEPFTLTWDEAQGPVTITVVQGPRDNLKPVTVITSTGSDGEFTWTPTDLPSGQYAFEIIDDTMVKNWSVQFTYTGTGSVTSVETPTSTAESSTSTEVSSTTSSSSETETTESSTSTTETEASSTTTFTTSTTEDAETTTSATTSPTGSPPDLNNGQRFASPLGFVLVTVAALVFFN